MENKYRFRDSSLSFDERVKDLLSRLTIKEKAGLMSSHMAAVPRLDIGEWYVGAEVARGYVSRNPDEPTTVFPQPIGLSGTFDTELMEKAGLAAGKEARVLNKRHPSGIRCCGDLPLTCAEIRSGAETRRATERTRS